MGCFKPQALATSNPKGVPTQTCPNDLTTCAATQMVCQPALGVLTIPLCDN